MSNCTSKALKETLETDIKKTLQDFSKDMSKTPDFSGVLGQCFREKIFSNSENGASVGNAKEALEAIKMDFESAYNLIKGNPDFATFKRGIEKLLSDIDTFLSGDKLSEYVSTANTESNTEVSTVVVKSELVDADPGFKFEIQEGSIFSNIFGESSQAKTKLRKAFEDRMFKCVTRYTDLSGETRYVKTLEELNENITKYKEEWYRILKEGADLKDETLYNEDGDSNFNSAMSDAKSALNSVLEKIDTLEFGESYMLGNNKLVNAAVAYYVLNNFDAFVIETTKFNRSKNLITISDYRKDLSSKYNKYTAKLKFTSGTVWTDDELSHDAIKDLSPLLLSLLTIPQWDINIEAKRTTKYEPLLVLSVIAKLKKDLGRPSSSNGSLIAETRTILDGVREYKKSTSFRDIILDVPNDPTTTLPRLFKALQLNLQNLEGYSPMEKNIIYSIYKSIYDESNSDSEIKVSKNSGDTNEAVIDGLNWINWAFANFYSQDILEYEYTAENGYTRINPRNGIYDINNANLKRKISSNLQLVNKLKKLKGITEGDDWTVNLSAHIQVTISGKKAENNPYKLNATIKWNDKEYNLTETKSEDDAWAFTMDNDFKPSIADCAQLLTELLDTQVTEQNIEALNPNNTNQSIQDALTLIYHIIKAHQMTLQVYKYKGITSAIDPQIDDLLESDFEEAAGDHFAITDNTKLMLKLDRKLSWYLFAPIWSKATTIFDNLSNIISAANGDENRSTYKDSAKKSIPGTSNKCINSAFAELMEEACRINPNLRKLTFYLAFKEIVYNRNIKSEDHSTKEYRKSSPSEFFITNFILDFYERFSDNGSTDSRNDVNDLGIFPTVIADKFKLLKALMDPSTKFNERLNEGELKFDEKNNDGTVKISEVLNERNVEIWKPFLLRVIREELGMYYKGILLETLKKYNDLNQLIIENSGAFKAHFENRFGITYERFPKFTYSNGFQDFNTWCEDFRKWSKIEISNADLLYEFLFVAQELHINARKAPLEFIQNLDYTVDKNGKFYLNPGLIHLLCITGQLLLSYDELSGEVIVGKIFLEEAEEDFVISTDILHPSVIESPDEFFTRKESRLISDLLYLGISISTRTTSGTEIRGRAFKTARDLNSGFINIEGDIAVCKIAEKEWNPTSLDGIELTWIYKKLAEKEKWEKVPTLEDIRKAYTKHKEELATKIANGFDFLRYFQLFTRLLQSGEFNDELNKAGIPLDLAKRLFNVNNPIFSIQKFLEFYNREGVRTLISKKVLASRELKAFISNKLALENNHDYIVNILTESRKQYIKNNLQTLSPQHISRLIFGNDQTDIDLTSLDVESYTEDIKETIEQKIGNLSTKLLEKFLYKEISKAQYIPEGLIYSGQGTPVPELEMFINPELVKYNLLNQLFGQSYTFFTMGTHVEKDFKADVRGDVIAIESEQMTQNTKRNVALTATKNALLRGRLGGVKKTYKIIALGEPTNECYNLFGDSDKHLKIQDGATYVNTITHREELHSLGGNPVGYITKPFVSSGKYGTRVEIKTAGFPIGNNTIKLGIGVPDAIYEDYNGGPINVYNSYTEWCYQNSKLGRFGQQWRLNKVMNNNLTWTQTLNLEGIPGLSYWDYVKSLEESETVLKDLPKVYRKNPDGTILCIDLSTLQVVNGYTIYIAAEAWSTGDIKAGTEKVCAIVGTQSKNVDYAINTYLNNINSEGRNFLEDDVVKIINHENPNGYINSNFQLWQYVFGGFMSMHKDSNGILTTTNDESSEDLLYRFSYKAIMRRATGDPNIHTTDNYIAPISMSCMDYAPTAGAIKAARINSNPLSVLIGEYDALGNEIYKKAIYHSISTSDTGPQLDAEHSAINGTVTFMSQVINALAARGYSIDSTDECYSGILALTEAGLEDIFSPDFKELLGQTIVLDNLRTDLAKLIVDTLITQRNTLSAGKIGLLEALLEGLAPIKNREQYSKYITLSNPTIFNKLISNIAAALSKSAIKFKALGGANVLAPSDGSILILNNHSAQYYIDQTHREELTIAQEESDNHPLVHSELVMEHFYKIKAIDDKGVTLYYNGETWELNECSVLLTPPLFYKLPGLGKGIEITEDLEQPRDLAPYHLTFKDTNGKLHNIWQLKAIKDCWDAEVAHSSGELSKEALEVRKSNMAQVLAAISPSGYASEVSVINETGEEEIVTVDKTSISIDPYEVILPNSYKYIFGITEGLDLQEILDDPNYFIKRLLDQEQSSLGPKNYSIALKTLNNSELYYLLDTSKDTLDQVVPEGFEKVTVHTTTDSLGNVYRVDPKTNKILHIMPNGLDFYLDPNTMLIIITGNTEALVELIKSLDLPKVSLGTRAPENLVEALQKDSDTPKSILNAINNLKVSSGEDLENDEKGLLLEILSAIPISERLDADTIEGLLGQIINAANTNEKLRTHLINAEVLEIANGALKATAKATKVVNKFKNNFEYIIKNGHELYTSFKKSLDFIVARTPSQCHQSFMKMRVIAFNDTEANVAYVSRWQLWLQGSDFDIDKASLMGFGFINGKFVTHSPYADISTDKHLEASCELPLPTGKELTIVSSQTNTPYTLMTKSIFKTIKERTINGTLEKYEEIRDVNDSRMIAEIVAKPSIKNGEETFTGTITIKSNLNGNHFYRLLFYYQLVNYVHLKYPNDNFEIVDTYSGVYRSFEADIFGNPDAEIENNWRSFNKLFQGVPTEFANLKTAFGLILANADGTVQVRQNWITSLEDLQQLKVLLSVYNKAEGILINKNNSDDKVLKEIIDTHNKYFSRIGRHLLRVAVLNFIIHKMQAISADPQNLALGQTSVDVPVNVIKALARKSETLGLLAEIDPGAVTSLFTLILLNIGAKDNIGIVATGMKGFEAQSMYVYRVLSQGTAADLEKLLCDLNIGGTEIKLIANAHAANSITVLSKNVEDALGTVSQVMDAFLNISGFLSLATDNAKDPNLSKVNGDSEMMPLYIAGTAVGLSNEFLTRVMGTLAGLYCRDLLKSNVYTGQEGAFSAREAILFLIGGPDLSQLSKDSINKLKLAYKGPLRDDAEEENELSVSEVRQRMLDDIPTALELLDIIRKDLINNAIEKGYTSSTYSDLKFIKGYKNWALMHNLVINEYVMADNGLEYRVLDILQDLSKIAGEMRIISQLILNLGLPNNLEELLTFVRSFEGIIKTAQRNSGLGKTLYDKLQGKSDLTLSEERLLERLRKLLDTGGLLDQLSKANEDIFTIQEKDEDKRDVRISLKKFFEDLAYRDLVLEILDQYTIVTNPLRVILNNQHYYGDLKAMYKLYKQETAESYLFEITDSISRDILRKDWKLPKSMLDLAHKQLARAVSYEAVGLFLNKGYSLVTIPITNPITVDLGTASGRLKFVDVMDAYIPTLKSSVEDLKDNHFIKSLILSSFDRTLTHLATLALTSTVKTSFEPTDVYAQNELDKAFKGLLDLKHRGSGITASGLKLSVYDVLFLYTLIKYTDNNNPNSLIYFFYLDIKNSVELMGKGIASGKIVLQYLEYLKGIDADLNKKNAIKYKFIDKLTNEATDLLKVSVAPKVSVHSLKNLKAFPIYVTEDLAERTVTYWEKSDDTNSAPINGNGETDFEMLQLLAFEQQLAEDVGVERSESVNTGNYEKLYTLKLSNSAVNEFAVITRNAKAKPLSEDAQQKLWGPTIKLVESGISESGEVALGMVYTNQNGEERKFILNIKSKLSNLDLELNSENFKNANNKVFALDKKGALLFFRINPETGVAELNERRLLTMLTKSCE